MKKCAAWGWAHFALRINYDLAGSALNQPASQPASQPGGAKREAPGGAVFAERLEAERIAH